MPHLVIEYSRNVENQIDLNQLMDSLRESAVSSGVMKAEDIKVRAIPYDHWKLVGRHDDFIHVTCRLLAGRTDEQKVGLAELLRDSAAKIATDVISISIDIVDMNPVAYKKRLLPSR